ncbi:IclR family transcriptional regulator [Saccharopolyspora erythraea NRRL 2338]|uniref:Transcriptional regulator, IclR family n=2 Tax=Saccharopolyspora erythraea TaxID=1836 RepID=A4FLJ2_SACEN|nr:IclR family transcriptional regulator [Saccharopolyspora erythraea]EQD85276.1 IclR family transcriptional regulator [Saccharopolyspora erythraea D]PFG98557.1 IclR family transcriptional regulator [Saccharopolyspora erythraea NRRL 2338]QRK88598.1 IclR family transcriptional regulator [Saccharopolyspora erythraea]CAM04917.1 transcriptional regulator, IclR family [Saccharopolyspora erythraea NRRL 2338]
MPDAPDAAPRGDMVSKALRLLVLLGEAPRGMTLSELARRAGYPVSTTHRLLTSIAREDFAVLDEERRWNLGLRLFELGQRVLHARGFTELATPVLRRITRETGEPTLMAVLDGHSQLYVHYVEGTRQVQITGEPGQRGPLHATSMGKCLIAFASEQAREELLETVELPPLGPRTITDRQRFREEIERVRRDGYAIADEEHEEGILAIGVPVLNPAGIAVAAVSSAAPAFRSSVEELRSYLPHLRRAAKELAVGLPPR